MVDMRPGIDVQLHTQSYAQDRLPGIADSQPASKGRYTSLSTRQLQSKRAKLFYTHPHGEIWLGDAISWLKTLKSESVNRPE